MIASFNAWKLRQQSCWCGAKPGERCVNREGRPSPTHNTRGKLSRKQVNIFMVASGQQPLPPLPGEEQG